MRLAAAAALLFASASIAQSQAQPDAGPDALRAAPANAADSAIERQVHRLAGELRCPVCQGLSIAASPTELSLQMKGVIREQLRAGRSPDQVKDYFVEKYGEWILLEPKASGFNLAVYLLPALVLLLGLVFVIVMLRRWTAASTDETAEPLDDRVHVPDLR